MANEKRLIDAHDLWSDIMMLPHNGDMISSEEVEQAIMETPTVDAVEVVRCKDCIRRYDHDECPMCHTMNDESDEFTFDDGFCDRGERESDENADDDLDEYSEEDYLQARCYECRGYGDDYYLDKHGELVCACGECAFNGRDDDD